jgi:hypothetical protein
MMDDESKTEKAPKKTPEIKVSEMLHRDEYFEKYHPDYHPYTIAYISENAHATIKSKDEWDALVKKHMRVEE